MTGIMIVMYLQRRLGNIRDSPGNCGDHPKGDTDVLCVRDAADDRGSANARGASA